MTGTSLDLFAGRVRDNWGALTSEFVADCSARLAELLQAPQTEGWLADLCHERPESRELYRDPVHGFVLLAHTEAEGRYRVPHDHGESWVIYGVLDGEMEMGIRDLPDLVRPGDVQVYLPGDIHDTRCVSGPAIQFRFTARDLRLETTMVRYADQGGVWVPSV